MFKPFDFWKMEAVHSGKLKKEAFKSPDRMKIKYETQDEGTLLRYIKLAEQSYDTAKGIKKKFNTFLTKNELELLFKNYGYPHRYRTVKEYYVSKNGLNVRNIDHLWKKLSENEKTVYREEFDKVNTEYILKMFHFSRDLPEARGDDFMAFMEAGGEEKTVPLTSTSNTREIMMVMGDPKQIKLFKYQYAPYEFYYEENKDKFNETSVRLNKVKARSAYIQLDDEAKLVYLKKCEKAFDHFDFRAVDNQKPILSAVLTKDEMKILFNAYGLPKRVGVNHINYYYMINCKKYKEDKMKNVMLDWGKLNETEKNEFIAKHHQDTESYIERKKKFENSLPKQRLIDLEYFERKESEVTTPEIKPLKTKKETKAEKNNVVSSPKDQSNDIEHVSDVEKIDFDELDKRVSFAKLVERLSTEEYYFENAFSCFVNERLKSQQKMDEADSLAFLKKVTKEWLKLDEADKEDFESKAKKSKKNFKKSYKKILENHSDITLEIEEVKSLIKSHARQISVKLDELTVEDLVLNDKSLADLIYPEIKEFEAKSKKPKEVDETTLKSDKKRKTTADSDVSGAKVKKSKSIKNEGLGFE